MPWQTPFSAKEDQFIRKNWPGMGPSEIARKLGRSRGGVSHRITALGLRGEACSTRARMKHADNPLVEHTAIPAAGSLLDVSRNGDEIKTLEALRDILAERIDATQSARDTATLAKRMIEVGERIAEVRDAGKKATHAQGVEVTRFDVIARRNAENRKAAKA